MVSFKKAKKLLLFNERREEGVGVEEEEGWRREEGGWK